MTATIQGGKSADPIALPLPEGVTMLQFGRWIRLGGSDVEAFMAWVQSQPPQAMDWCLERIEAAVELAETSTDAASYLTDPVGWIERYVEFPKGESLTDYQAECLTTLAEEHRLALRGPHGLGKSGLAALAILWFSLTREAAGIDWKLPTTASAWRQITHFLWPEVHKWAGRIRWKELGRDRFTGNELQTLRIKLVYGEAWGQAAKDANSIEGAHATHLFYIFDEGKGIAAALWTAAEGAFSGAGSDTANEAWFLALSVPGAPAGPFFDIHTRKRGYENWKVRHVKKEEAIRAGRISAEWVEMMRRRFGEKSAIYQQRVEGNFAADASNSVIPLEWVEAAHERWHDLAVRGVDLGPIRAAGLDIARDGDDESVLSMSAWDCVLPLIRPQGATSPLLVARVKVELSKLPGRPVVVVDADGLGAGYYDVMVQGIDWQDRVMPFRASAAPQWKDHSGLLVLGNMRSAAWWSLRDELDPNRPDFTPTLALPDDELLTGDLTTPTYREGAGGRIYVEEKAEIKKRLGRSTDSGDSVVMCRVGMRWGARATITAAQHTNRRPGTPGGDLRRGEDAAGPDHGSWSPLKVAW